MFERVAPEQFDTLPEIPEPCENPLLLGHEEARHLLASAIGAGKLHHALLLAGPQGIGKATLAFHLAYHLLSGTRGGDEDITFTAPDPASQTFRLIAQGAHPSLLHLTRPFMEKERKFRTVITVEEIRRVSRFLSMTSFDGGYRVVIVDPAEDMNTSAANALLKSLEEPPPRTIFILITHSPGRLLPTIRSRCQVMRLQPLDDALLADVLARLGAEIPSDPAARDTLFEQAGGSPRNAFLLTQYGGLEIAEAIAAVLSARRFDVEQAYKLGEAVNGRERDVQFSIFNRNLLELLAKQAEGAAAQSHREHAFRLSELWQGVQDAVVETDTYNLDRRQHVVGLLGKTHHALRELSSAD
jgi:DNA polymerase-3 subunit delta'